MAIIKCEKCGAEYDDELNEKCPYCENAETEDACEDDAPVVDAYDAQTEEGEVIGEAEEVAGDLLDGDGEATGDVEEIDDGLLEEAEGVQEAPAKSNKALVIVAAILAVCVVAAAAWLIYSKVSGPDIPGVAPVTMSNADKLTADDLNGKYTDDVNGTYYEFKKEAAEIDVPVEKEETEDPAADSAVDSAADSAASQPEIEYEKKKFDGSYVTGIDEGFIPELVAEVYVNSNQKKEDYEAYKAEKNLTKDDYLGFVKANGMEEDVKAYDEQQQITSYYSTMQMNGYWNLENGDIKLYDESGNETEVLVATPSGLTYKAAFYAGKLGGKKNISGVFSAEVSDGIKQTIRFYEDGYFILENSGTDTDAQVYAGTYKATEGGLVLVLNGQETTFQACKAGIVACLFNK